MRMTMAVARTLKRRMAFAVAFLAVGLSACSGPSVATNGGAPPTPAPMRVVISVQTLNPVQGVREKSVGPSANVTSFYHAILAIPASSPPWSCGKVTGYYDLVFYRGSRYVATVDLPIAGCPMVMVEIPGKSPYDALFPDSQGQSGNVWYLLAQLVHRSVNQLYQAQL